MFPGAPRPLVTLLSLVVFLRLLIALFAPEPDIFPLLQFGILAFFAWQTLEGEEVASHVLVTLLLIGGVLDACALLGAAATGAPLVLVCLVHPLFYACVAAYLVANRRVKEFLTGESMGRSYVS